MINNRQNGRRRGRGGGGPRPPSGSPNQANRQDNRSRGNASQLHEKYKTLARDAQMQGDRVQSEYYLQFADHYFRVLSETRGRFEEQRRPRDDFSDEEEDQDEALDYAAEETDREDRPERQDRQERAPRFERSEREDRGSRREGAERQDRQDRQDRGERDERNGQPAERMARNDREDRGPEQNAPRRQRLTRPQPAAAEGSQEERISLEVLPPAISPDGDESARAPRRRTRRPRPEGEAEIAPAA